MCAYYETIDGARCDRAIVNECRDAVAGVGDGRVSVEDAKKVYEALADGGQITPTERWTLYYCLTDFKWTDAAHDWIIDALKGFRKRSGEEPPVKVAKVGATSYYEVIDGMKTKRAIIDLCRDSVAGKGDGRVSTDDAKTIWEKAVDGGRITRTERWSIRFCLAEFKWTRAAHDWVLEEIKSVMKTCEEADKKKEADKKTKRAASGSISKTDDSTDADIRGWEFHTSDGWVPFDDETVFVLDKAVAEECVSTECAIGPHAYIIDFKAMTQCNRSSNRTRRIRCTGVAQAGVDMCKMGCGRKVALGTTARGRAYKTCCRTCAVGEEGHCESCNPA